ncbi:MAG TPA: anion permease [Actinomycetota bacterium]
MSAAVVLIVAIALAFDFFNGFHDAANSIATVVSTRVLTPRIAVAWAAFFNFAAFVIFGTAVARTIAKDVVTQNVLSNAVILAGLIGAIAWDIVTWWLGLPTSSSHALVGGLAGAAVARSGWSALLVAGFQKIAVFIILSPLIGLLLAFTIMVIVFWVFHRYRKVDRLNHAFRRVQLLSAAAFSLGHGANDAQKTMGVIYALLLANGVIQQTAGVPLWVVLSAHTAIGLGTMFGGWRIVHTMGSRITKLNPVGGMSAELAAASTLFFTAHAGIPVSTTHTITGAIVGVGTTQRLSAVRWGVAGRVVWAWLLTIPGAFLVAWVAYLPFRALG